MSTDRLPVFVYGTLRNSLGNYERILRGNTLHEETATLAGATMLHAGGFPFVLDKGTGTVVGEVMYLTPDNADYTMARLDRLEGCYGMDADGKGDPRNMYDRKVVTVTTADGAQVEAHTYIMAPGMRKHMGDWPVIASGDWKIDGARMRTPMGV